MPIRSSCAVNPKGTSCLGDLVPSWPAVSPCTGGNQDVPPSAHGAPHHDGVAVGIDDDGAFVGGAEDVRAGSAVAIDDHRRGMAEGITFAGAENHRGGM